MTQKNSTFQDYSKHLNSCPLKVIWLRPDILMLGGFIQESNAISQIDTWKPDCNSIGYVYQAYSPLNKEGWVISIALKSIKTAWLQIITDYQFTEMKVRQWNWSTNNWSTWKSVLS